MLASMKEQGVEAGFYILYLRLHHRDHNHPLDGIIEMENIKLKFS
jgi:hypothetical protein